MKTDPRVDEAVAKIINMFQNPDELPKALAQIVLNTGRWCSRWSWNNQLIVMMHGHPDAMTAGGWRKHTGRMVKKGERAFAIIRPVTRWVTVAKVDDDGRPVVDNDGNPEKKRINIIIGFEPHLVFGLDQTRVIDEAKWERFNGEAGKHLEVLPWMEVATAWGVTVEAQNTGCAAGYFSKRENMIALGVKNLSTWAHELVHAAEARNGNLTESFGQDPGNEIVAELGGAILLEIIGMPSEADLGGAWDYIKHYAPDDPMAGITKVLDRTRQAVGLILSSDDKREVA